MYTKLVIIEMNAIKLNNWTTDYMHKCVWLSIQKRGIIECMFRIYKSHLKAKNKCASENLVNPTLKKKNITTTCIFFKILRLISCIP